MEKLRYKEKIGYGFGDFASSMFWKMFGVYLLFFYTDVFGISATVVGTMFLITRIFDGINDPIMGIIADKTNTKWGKFRPYLLWMAIPFGVFGILTFTTPNFSISSKIIYAYVTYCIMMVVYTAINVPYASLMGVMTSNLKDRTSLASFRFVFAFAGSILVLATAEPLVDYFAATDDSESTQKAWQYTMAIYAIIAIGFFIGTFYLTRERIQPPKNQKTAIKTDLKNLAKNKPWFVLLASGIFSLIFNSIRDGSTIYYFKYYFKTQDAFQLPIIEITITFSTLYLVLGQAANILGVIMAKPVSDSIGKKKTFIGAMLIASLLSCAFFFLGESDVTLIFVFQFLISICAGIIFPLLWSMYADIADFSEWKTGRRATGLIFSSSSMSQKMGWTLGGALTGWILGFYGFEANTAQTEAAQTGIRLMMSFLPAAGALLSAILLIFYTLDDKLMLKINRDLIKRKSENENNNNQ
ncbi:MFS transporter [Flagellimonas sp. HMM57]|uniref:MFS transporter n=1 Tax=unclassified Flagellimonas TaxID=2644544 RepID=UPI0013D2A6E9|nr:MULTISPECIES: MFS transporter [unclassified Flagellimonas]UII76472.1 MFS transporter [Flagellimonas sp. HMM57]